MIEVLVLMAFGFTLGLFLRSFPKVRVIIDRLTMWTIYLLLAIMGFAIGSNSQLIKQLPNIGFQSAIIATGAVAGSVVLAWILFPFLFKKKQS
ncbi:MAG TPA: LysO family transporter [Salinivirgaceae bacterium]|nr:LysO family transporter [Salinivirgaceae bacterium]